MIFKPWRRRAMFRRTVLGLLIIVPALVGAEFMAGALPQPGNVILDDATVVIFGLLMAWVTFGFWTALFGFCVFVARGTPPVLPAPDDTRFPQKPTALVVPVYKESPEHVAATIEVMYRGLEARGVLSRFEFYVLSDSDDPDACVREQWAWANLCHRLGGFDRIHYRRRRVNIKRKTGNIADFLRRWGQRHEYMIVLDADSLLSADTLLRLVTLMESNPGTGIIQTVPGIMRQTTLFGRMQQFANRLYGPMFAAGLAFWQLGDSYYWGHNAIIRVTPFMQHCNLPRLRGHAPLSGDILSHDFVEAALLRRAGWSTWLVSEIGGSWEETPPTLLDELKRDRRWCHGNLQHLRLLLAKGILATHRLMFINGAMSYITSVLWFVYLLLGTAILAWHALVPPDYFPAGHGLFPVWPVWHRGLAVVLLALTLLILFLPKFLAVLLAVLQRRSKGFGGAPRLLASMLLELVHASLLAPVRMLFHSCFVLASLAGGGVHWGPQRREAHGTSWHDALRFHIPGTLLAIAWGAFAYSLDPEFLWWLIPVLGALVIAIPLSVYTSRTRAGRWAHRLGLFLTPEEQAPPAEIMELECALDRCVGAAVRAAGGFRAAIVDPYVNAVVIARLSPAARHYSEEAAISRDLQRAKLLARGTLALDHREQLAILRDRALLLQLHAEVWALPPGRASQWLSPEFAELRKWRPSWCGV
ncbi:MAG: glucans biosynthesis glucosyltransferase MdoH [Gammaproteobacteria bacterium]